MGKELHYMPKAQQKERKEERKTQTHIGNETIRVGRDRYHLSAENNSKRKPTYLSLYKLLHKIGKSISYKEYRSKNDRKIIIRHGVPERIITDRGSQFMAKVFREIVKMVQIKHLPTTAYHPQTDGQIERTVGILKRIIRKLVRKVDEWDLQLPYTIFAYKTAIHETTKETLFFLMYGRDPLLLSDLFMNKQIKVHKRLKNYIIEIVKRFKATKQRVRKETLKQKQ